MLRVAWIILHSVVAIVFGCWGALWFGNGGYVDAGWVGFIVGVVLYLCVVSAVTLFLLFVVFGEIKGDLE